MRWIIGLTIAMAVAGSSVAQTTQPSPRALELARRIVLINGDEKTMIAASERMMAQQAAMMEERSKKMRQDMGLPPRETPAPTNPASTMAASMVPKLVEAKVNIYASSYIEDELQGMLDYFASPIGQSILAKTPAVNEKLGQATLAIINEEVAKLMEGLTEALKKLRPPAARPAPSAGKAAA